MAKSTVFRNMWFNVLEILLIFVKSSVRVHIKVRVHAFVRAWRERESYPPYQIMLYSQRHVFASLFLCLFTGQSFPLILGILGGDLWKIHKPE